MKWDDDLFLERTPQRRKVLQLAMYATHLATGSTLYCRRIKASTIETYVFNIATFLMRFGRYKVDPRKPLDSDKLHPLLKNVFVELRRWEQMPDRREPFTLEMLDVMHSTDTFGHHPTSSCWMACTDWFNVGLHAGLRLTEWAQDAHHAALQHPLLDRFGNPKAFCLQDVRFELRTRTRLNGADILGHSLSTIAKCWIKFRTQKNGDHGQERLHTNSGRRSFVVSMVNIIQRFVLLVGTTATSTPLAIYSDDSGVVRFITSTDIESTMRTVASHVYNLDPSKHKTALAKWSAHSLRVGACVILHATGFTEPQIKWLLRWRSNAFMAYLRNISALSDKQNVAFDTAGAMPHLF